MPSTYDSSTPDSDRATPDEIAEHVASIRAISRDELPDDDARAALIALAEAGHDCYAYRPLGATWRVVWVRPPHAWQDGRMTPAQWTARYHQGHDQGHDQGQGVRA